MTCSVGDPACCFIPILSGSGMRTMYVRLTNSNRKVLNPQITDILDIQLLTKVGECYSVEE